MSGDTSRFSLRSLLTPAVLFAAAIQMTQAATHTVPSGQASSIMTAMLKAKKGDTVLVAKGAYAEAVAVGAGVTLLAEAPLEATIEGTGRENAVTLGNNSAVIGFRITGATIGVYSSGVGNTIAKCLILRNQQTGIMCVGHLPKIEDNFIVFNGGSGVQGWDVRSTAATINHNTVAYNSNHGISVGGNSDIVVENNIVAHNEKIGLKTEPPVKVALSHNNFYANTELTEVLPASNFSLDPEFVGPKQLDFSLGAESKCRGRGSDNQDLGARNVK